MPGPALQDRPLQIKSNPNVKYARLKSRQPLQTERQIQPQRRPAEAGRYKFTGEIKNDFESNLNSSFKSKSKSKFKGNVNYARLKAAATNSKANSETNSNSRATAEEPARRRRYDRHRHRRWHRLAHLAA